jgi:hypothetical protein
MGEVLSCPRRETHRDEAIKVLPVAERKSSAARPIRSVPASLSPRDCLLRTAAFLIELLQCDNHRL